MLTGARPQRIMQVKKRLKSVVQRLALLIGPRLYIAYAALVFATSRIVWIGFDGVWKAQAGGMNHLAALWHEDILLAAFGFRKRGIAVLVSQSRDGELIARALQRCGFRTVRGSSSRGGPEAMRHMTQQIEAEQGLILALIVDGPRGPRHVVKPGVVALSKRSGLPVLPVRCRAKRNIVFNSWDRIRLPLPFNRLMFVCGEGMPVPAEVEDTDFDGCGTELAHRLNTLGADADGRLQK